MTVRAAAPLNFSLLNDLRIGATVDLSAKMWSLELSGLGDVLSDVLHLARIEVFDHGISRRLTFGHRKLPLGESSQSGRRHAKPASPARDIVRTGLELEFRAERMHETPTVVAIVNTNPDLVRILRMSLEKAGFVVFVLHIEDMKLGAADVDSFLRQHDPKVIVYDVAPPYEMNWRFLDHLRAATGFQGRQFVLTSVNVRRVREIVGTDETVYEVAGEPDDVAAVIRAVKEASRARATR